MKTYRINKIYIGRESKNIYGYETGIKESDVQFQLDVHESSWRRHGGLVVSRSEEQLVVEEPDGSQTITFDVVEE